MASKTEWTADKGDRSAACKGLRLQHADGHRTAAQRRGLSKPAF
jgi:hypothetical protein